MVNAEWKSCLAVLLLGAVVLTGVAALRSAEYDEQYTLFLTAGVARPVWPTTPFAAGEVVALQAGHATLAGIARDLRATDVHPPLYFWAVALWRRLCGGGLLLARLFSVLCGVAALAAVWVIARRVGVPAALAMLLTLGCYGFAYTGAIARGFGLAQALTLWGAAVSLGRSRRRDLAAGLLLGAATLANYLAVFVAIAVAAGAVAARGNWVRSVRLVLLQARNAENTEDHGDARSGTGWARVRRYRTQASSAASGAAWLQRTHQGKLLCNPPWSSVFSEFKPCSSTSCTGPTAVAAAMLPFLLADLWFFLAQRNSRVDQFPPFHLFAALHRLARCAAGAMLGGLPLYVPAWAQPPATAALGLLALAGVALVSARWRHIGRCVFGRGLLLAATIAPPAGLLLLGAAFRNTPIELRYLAFAAPFAALLLAGALASLAPRWRAAGTMLLLGVQAAALAGLMLRPETMQPARATAAAAARFAGDDVMVVPRGNDGVGIVAAVAIEAPPVLRLLVVDARARPEEIAARIDRADRVVLALIAQDDASRATLPLLRAAMAGPCWRLSGQTFNAAAFERTCRAQPKRPD